MSEISELERRANQYITEHVAKGGRREDVLADWVRSENPDLQKYAKGIFAKDLNPDQAAAEVTTPPNTSAPATPSYLTMAKDMAPVIGTAALGAGAVGAGSYYLGKKKGEGIAPPSGSSQFEIDKQNLELDRLRAQVETERARAARLTQMANKGQPLQTQSQFSEPTPIEVTADTTSVKVPSPATVETEASRLDALTKRADDLRAAIQSKAPVAPPELAPMNPEQLAASFRGEAPVPSPSAPAPLPSATPSSDATKNVAETINGLMNETSNKPALKTQSSGVNQYLNMFGYQKTNPTSERSLAAIDATNKLVDQAFQGVAPKGASGNPEGYRNQYIPFIEQNANTLAPVTQQQLNKSRTKGQVDTVNKLIASGVPLSQIGKATPGALGASAAAAVIPALAVAGIQGYKGNKEAVDRELKDAWESLKSVVTMPYDVAKAATKGDFGPFKDLLMSVNPATLLLNEANKADEQTLKSMIQAEKVGAGRGIAPPSAYMR